jgi:Tfp pilus assembly protein PilO
MRRQIAVAVVAAVAVVLLLLFALIEPKSHQVGQVRQQVADAQRQEESLRLQLRQLENAKANATATEGVLATFNQLLPSTADLPTFIRIVQAAANADGVNLQSIAPSPPTTLQVTGGGTASGVNTISVNLSLSAGFFRLESFLSRLELLQRVVEVRNVSIAGATDPNTGAFTLQSTITLIMYVVQPNASVPRGAIPAPPTPTPSASASPTSSPGA